MDYDMGGDGAHNNQGHYGDSDEDDNDSDPRENDLYS